jgi:hypothetical protein
MLMLTIVSFHTHRTQGVWKTFWKGDFWRYVDLLRVAKAAARHGAPLSALFFLELWRDQNRHVDGVARKPSMSSDVQLATRLARRCYAALNNVDAQRNTLDLNDDDNNNNNNNNNDDDDDDADNDDGGAGNSAMDGGSAAIANYSRGKCLSCLKNCANMNT